MSVGARAFVAICALGGGGVSWLLHKFNSGNSTSLSSLSSSTPPSANSSESTTDSPSPEEQYPKVPTESSTQSPSLTVRVNAGNCTLEETLKDLEDALWDNLEISSLDTFIKVTCTNTNKDSDSQMSNSWEGVFPDSLFKERTELTKGKKFEIKTQTESLEGEKFRTTFSGSHFYDDVVGEWIKKVTSPEGKKEATEVKIVSSRSSSQKIYLLFK